MPSFCCGFLRKYPNKTRFLWFNSFTFFTNFYKVLYSQEILVWKTIVVVVVAVVAVVVVVVIVVFVVVAAE